MTTNPFLFKEYPYYPVETLEDVRDQLRDICYTRKDDIATISKIPSSFVSGRKVGKVPTASNDVEVTDRLGDINYDASYLYILIDNSGTPAWRRVALSSW
jgi:hypothetical protein